MVPPASTMSYVLYDGVPSSPNKKSGAATLSRTTSIPKDYAHIVTGEMGVEFECLSNEILIYGLCRELPPGAATVPELAQKAVTLSLWETESQKLIASCTACVAKDKPEAGNLIHQDRFLAGKFDKPVQLSRGKLYRISVGKEDENAANFVWINYGGQTEYMNGMKAAGELG